MIHFCISILEIEKAVNALFLKGFTASYFRSTAVNPYPL